MNVPMTERRNLNECAPKPRTKFWEILNDIPLQHTKFQTKKQQLCSMPYLHALMALVGLMRALVGVLGVFVDEWILAILFLFVPYPFMSKSNF